MQKKEPEGNDSALPDGFVLDDLTPEKLKPLTVAQIKQVRKLIDEEVESIGKRLIELENLRNESHREIGNLLHEDVVFSNDEVKTYRILFDSFSCSFLVLLSRVYLILVLLCFPIKNEIFFCFCIGRDRLRVNHILSLDPISSK